MKPASKGDEISVLYVEDDPDAREMVGRALAKRIRHLRLFTAENGEEGLTLFRKHRQDIIITDLNMPVMDGIRMAAEIKSRDPEALIIAVTAYSDTGRLLDAINTGISHYVLKPVDYGKLFAAIDACIETVILKRRVNEQNAHIRQLSRAIEASPSAVLITDRRGIIRYTNPKFTAMTGYSNEEVVGQNPRILKSDRMPASAYEELWNTITAGREWRGEFLNRKKEGDLYWESASISPIFDEEGAISHFVSVKEDITDRKRDQEQIEALNTTLAARALELEDANRELEAFNYTVSHDLRKPLTNINCFCQVIQELCGTALDEQCRGYVDDIIDETMRMSQLISTILAFSRLKQSELRTELVDLSAIAEKISLGLRLAEPQRRVIFRIAEGVLARGDGKLLGVVLENLLGNAWKYTGKREEAIIEFGALEMGNAEFGVRNPSNSEFGIRNSEQSLNSALRTPHSELVFYVRDNGAGFDMAYAEKLFIPFERLPGSRDFEGHGIGLATVDRIIRRHGGRIWAEGEPDKGAAFYFTLPSEMNPPSS